MGLVLHAYVCLLQENVRMGMGEGGPGKDSIKFMIVMQNVYSIISDVMALSSKNPCCEHRTHLNGSNSRYKEAKLNIIPCTYIFDIICLETLTQCSSA